MFKKLQSNIVPLLIIFFAFFGSCTLSMSNLQKYDINIKKDNSEFYHQMIKFDTHRFMAGGYEIKEQLKNGANFFETGSENFTKYLPSRIAAAYYYFFNIDLYLDSNKEIIKTGVHLPYLIIQSFFYYFSLIIFYFSLKKIFNYSVCFLIIIFLSIEPTILQYHSTFWSESIFFSLQIILLSLVLKNAKNSKSFFLIGILLSFMALQKELAYFYVFIILLYYLIFLEKKIKPLILIFFSFLLIQLLYGYNNYKRSGVFYLFPATTKFDLHLLIVNHVVTKKENITSKEFFYNEGVIALDWLKKNSIEFNISNDLKKPDLWNYREAILEEKDRVKFDEFILKRSKYFFVKYPWDFAKYASVKSLHMLLLNPFHIYSDHKYPSGEVYYNSKEHKDLIPYRIIYSLTIYLIIFLGFIKILKKKYLQVNIFLFLSVFYFYFTISWHGNTRYILPSFIYLSIFFGFGFNEIIKFLKKSNKVDQK
jgi:hypothetical protein